MVDDMNRSYNKLVARDMFEIEEVLLLQIRQEGCSVCSGALIVII